jgi:excisionase family DNA binding protein
VSVQAPPVLAVDGREAARLMGISHGMVKVLVDRGELPSFKIGRSRRILVAAINAYIRDRSLDSAQ